MRYLIKQKFFSLSDGFTIKDEAGNDCFKVKSKVITVGKKLSLCDMSDKEAAFIEQKLLKLFPEYHISVDSQEVMVIKQKFSLLSKKFAITGSAGEYEVEGNLRAKDFRITKNGSISAVISKKFLAVSDTYTIDIDDKENNALMLAVAIVLDMVCNDGNK